jgi:1-deoxy-D-xylulose-5-phosphate reductoisomerase
MFPAIGLCRQALRDGDSAPAILNAANEVAVAAFLKRKIGFLDIATTVEWTLNKFAKTPIHSLEDVFFVDQEARIIAGDRVSATRVVS